MSDFLDRAAIAEACEKPGADGDTTGNGLESVVRRRIDERTHRRIKDLCVKGVDGTVVVSGRADRYYVVQLALAAAQEVLAPGGAQMKIAVCWPTSPHGK